MSKALEKTYDGIIIGAGHHGLILGSYLARAGLDILLVERRLAYGGGLCTPRSDAARLLSQSAFDQSFPYQRNAVVQGSEPGRTRHLHHAALRIRPGASATAPRWCFGRDLEEIGRQYRALLEEGRRDVPRMEPQGREDHRADLAARTLCRAVVKSRARGAAVAYGARPRISGVSNRQPLDVVRELFENEHRRALCSCSRCRCSAPGSIDTLSKTSADGLGDPRLRPAKAATSSARAARSIWRAA